MRSCKIACCLSLGTIRRPVGGVGNWNDPGGWEPPLSPKTIGDLPHSIQQFYAIAHHVCRYLQAHLRLAKTGKTAFLKSCVKTRIRGIKHAFLVVKRRFQGTKGWGLSSFGSAKCQVRAGAGSDASTILVAPGVGGVGSLR